MAKRDPRLDVLRGVAVLMVLVHHSPTSLGSRLRAGFWTGVDLFFVLSGFLVSGLLFREYLQTGRIQPWRFYLRRGFKIYPNFYLMLIVGAALQTALGPPLVPRLVLHDAVFVQNYLGAWWGHTWSLAVEEHFYLLLPPVLLLLLGSAAFRRAPVRWASVLMATLGVVLLVCRTWLVASGRGTIWHILFKTHLRLDSLAFGVLLSVVWHFTPERVTLVRRFRVPLLIAGLLLTLPAYLLHYEHPFILAVGLTMLYVGYGMVLAAALTITRGLAGPFTPALAFFGVYSYSIYLWHYPIHHVLIWLGAPRASVWIYFAGSLVVGVLSAKAVEFPTLRLRDRWFPAATTTPALATHTASGSPRGTPAGDGSGIRPAAG